MRTVLEASLTTNTVLAQKRIPHSTPCLQRRGIKSPQIHDHPLLAHPELSNHITLYLPLFRSRTT